MMNQQESTRAVIVSVLRAGRTVKEIMNIANIKKSTVLRREEEVRQVMTSAMKILKRHSDYKGTALAEDLRELVTRDPSRSMRSMAQEMNVSRTMCVRCCRRTSVTSCTL